MILAHRIRLVPTGVQEAYFRRASGVKRFAYNWGLDQWQRAFEAGEKLTEAALRRRLNAIKDEQFPWMRDVTKNAPQQAIKNLGRAYRSFFGDLEKYRAGHLPWKRVRRPTFKKKGRHDSFRADNGPDKQHPNAVAVAGKSVKLPKLGWVRMREAVRFCGRILSVTVSRQADAWFASFAVECAHEAPVRTDDSVVGVDLGVTALATLSDGSPKVEAPRPLQRNLRRLERLSRALARKQRGSANRAKAKLKLARLHRRIANIRLDALHKLTTGLARFGTIAIEDLNVTGMLANRRLSRAVADLGFFEFRRQLNYKAAMAGARVVVVDRWFASSKLCSVCRTKNDTLTLGERTWTCPSCGTFHDRDVNAACNLARAAESSPVAAPGADGAGSELDLVVKPAA